MEIYEAGVMDRAVVFSDILDLYFAGDMEASVGLAGQGSAMITEVKPVKEIIEETVDGFFEIAGRFGAMRQGRNFG
jgi:enoyl-[acyl-carrier protein] reductase II